MGFAPATGPTLKTVLCYIRALVGRMINNRGSARGVMVFVVGNEHGDTSSNPGRD